MKDFNSMSDKDIILQKVWKLFDVLRGDVNTEDYSVVLLFIYLRSKDLIPFEFINSNRFNVKNEFLFKIQDQIREKYSIDNASLDFDFYLYEKKEALFQIINFYNHTIISTRDNTFFELIDILFLLDSNCLNENIEEVFEQTLERIALSQGRRGGEFMLPKQLTEFINTYIGSTEGLNVFNPFAGLGSFMKEYQNSNLISAQELNPKIWAIGQLRLLVHKTEVDFRCEDSIENWPQEVKFDLIVSNPPFGMRLNGMNRVLFPNFKTAEEFLLNVGLDSLSSSGRLIAVLPQGILFTNGDDKQLRKRLIEEDLIDTIISFPGGILHHTGIPFIVLVLNKAKDNLGQIKLIDANEYISKPSPRENVIDVEKLVQVSQQDENAEAVRIISSEDVVANDYNLLLGRYFTIVDKDLIESKNLQEIRKFLTPTNRTFPSSSGLKTKKISVKDLSTSSDQFTINVDALDDYTGDQRVVGFDDEVIIIARVGDKLKPSYLPFNGNDIGFSLLNVFAFTINREMVHIDYLIQELNKPYVYKQLDRYRSIGTVPTIRLDDLLSIKIHVLNPTEQKSSVKEEKEIRFQELAKLHGFENEIIRLKELQRKDLGSKKHNIMQHLNNVKSSSEIIRKMFIKNNGTLNATDVINPNTGITVEDRLVKLQESIESVLYYVDNLTNEISFDKLEVVNLYEFIKVCVQRGIQYDHFEIIDDSDLDSFEEYKPNVEISKRDFEELYNNILENAINHGFINPDTKYIFRFNVAIINNKVELLFENNGKPFPKGMGDIQMYSTRGEKAGVTANTGEGSWKVAQIANHFNAELIVIDEPENEYPVGIKLVFKLSE